MSVALRKESVDRNIIIFVRRCLYWVSLSARRAWIEILIDEIQLEFNSLVALRKESVDRNPFWSYPPVISPRSLSARRAWIEMTFSANALPITSVALRKESVDRNMLFLSFPVGVGCRSPQGERG